MHVRLPVLFFAATVALAACGGGGGGDQESGQTTPTSGSASGSVSAAPGEEAAPVNAPVAAPRRVEIEMFDIGFRTTSVDVKRGDTVSFVFTNRGKIPHDAFLGDKAQQDNHESEMRAMTGDSHAGHEGGITVNAGETGALRQTFAEPGSFEIGCHQPGHYAAGMKVTIDVT